ncbi:SGNH/GDSL hydrolase family protein [Bhargavaea ullalensis]|uniref:Lysophospholipase L1-like esterase n=1 Tax=Bhargavaea ullalensis TaxID=1265685 RepID=A0ABV2GCS4_9BACL
MKRMRWIIVAAAVGALLLLFKPDGRGGRAAADVARIEAVDPFLNPGQPVADYLVYRALSSGEARMAVTGSSVTRGTGATAQAYTWRGLTEQKLRLAYPALKHLKIGNFGHSGYTSVRLLEDEVTAPILAAKPDVLVIETSVINNHNKNVSLEDTYDSLRRLHELYTGALPEARIVFLSPNPCTDNQFGPPVNALGLRFTDYVYGTEAFIRDQGWDYVNVHDEMLAEMQNRDIALPDTLKDGIHPNDLGYAIWADILWPHLTTR